MIRSDVFERIVDIPMQIKLQREGDKIVAMLPAYHMPLGMMVEADDAEEAIQSLREKVMMYWRGRLR